MLLRALTVGFEGSTFQADLQHVLVGRAGAECPETGWIFRLCPRVYAFLCRVTAAVTTN